MWAAFALGGVYHLLRDKPWHGVALCGVAFAVKPQGVFIFPLLLLLALAGRIRWRTLLAAPAVYLALDAPAILFGRDPIELLTVYAMSRQARNVPTLSMRAPSVYAFLPPGTRSDSLRAVGYVFAAAAVLAVCYLLIARAVELTRERTVTMAALFALLVPFLLPGMHERYFFLADVTTLVLAVYKPRLWYVPLLVQAGSLISYESYLFGRVMPQTVPATLMLVALVVLGHHVVRDALAPQPVAEVSRPPAARPEPLPARPA
jgi:Gpi18-like mannosyltransferase